MHYHSSPRLNLYSLCLEVQSTAQAVLSGKAQSFPISYEHCSSVPLHSPLSHSHKFFPPSQVSWKRRLKALRDTMYRMLLPVPYNSAGICWMICTVILQNPGSCKSLLYWSAQALRQRPVEEKYAMRYRRD